MTLSTAAAWIEGLGLIPHPEGGHYREVYRAAESIPKTGLPNRFPGARSVATSIYYLLEAGSISRFHRIRSDELWHFYAGDALDVVVIHPVGRLETLPMGIDVGAGRTPLNWVPAGAWFAAHVPADAAYALAGCTVAPGFDFEDFEMAEREALVRLFPQHQDVIVELT